MPMNPHPPRIGLTPHTEDGRISLRETYLDAVWKAGGIPHILSPIPGSAQEALRNVDAVIFTGGDDPDMRAFGEPLHPEAKVIDPHRQAFEMELLAELDHQESKPILGICLGMQLMGIHAGGHLEQYLADRIPTAADHLDGRLHQIEGTLGSGQVHSHHRQALVDPGNYEIAAVAHDGVIEAIHNRDLPHRIGVQWHPERTTEQALGPALFTQLVKQAISNS